MDKQLRQVDEQRLIELFRLISDEDRSNLLITLSKQILISLSQAAVGTADDPIMLPTEEDEADPEDFTEEFLSQVKPPQEPWVYLDEYIHPALEHAWPGGIVGAILGSAIFDEYSAADLMSGVEAYAEDASTEEPWFSENEMTEFILAWRKNFMSALTKLQQSSLKAEGKHAV